MIEVEVKVVGMFGSDFITVSKKVSLKDGSRPKHALAALYEAGVIDKSVYKQIKSFRPPVFLVHNDQKVQIKPKKVELADGDTLGVMQMAAGG